MTHQTTSHISRRVKLGVLLVFFLLLGFGCKGGERVIESLPQVSLEYWTVWDEAEDFSAIAFAYRTLHPNVNITIRKFTYDEYEERLLQAWARGEGPDIFSIPNTSVGKYRDLITPLPSSLQLPTLVVSGGCSKDVRVVNEPVDTLRPELLDQTYVPVVADDVIFNNNIYGLPLATDNLALFYNKDLLNAAKIIAPPQTWQEFADMVDSTKSTLTKEEQGEIVQSGAALGTADNIIRSFDILSVLMMQSGAMMTDASGTRATFQDHSTTDKEFYPGASALNFYNSFANPIRVTYSWNDTLPEAQEAFAAGQVAFFLGYAYHIPALRLQNPQLNFGIAPLPQISIEGPEITYGNYWVESVAANSDVADHAWDFLLFATSADNVTSYLNNTGKLTALKSLVSTQAQELDLGVFADQALIAKTWYHGYDDAAAEEYFKDAIRSVNEGTEAREALDLAAQRINQTLAVPRD